MTPDLSIRSSVLARRRVPSLGSVKYPKRSKQGHLDGMDL